MHTEMFQNKEMSLFHEFGGGVFNKMCQLPHEILRCHYPKPPKIKFQTKIVLNEEERLWLQFLLVLGKFLDYLFW